MKHFIFSILVTLVALPQSAYSQCTDSSTVAASNYYLIKGAEAREQLALCIEFRKVDAEIMREQDKIQAKLLDEIQRRDDKIIKLRRGLYIFAASTLLLIIL